MIKFERDVQKGRQLDFKAQSNYKTGRQRREIGHCSATLQSGNCQNCSRSVTNHFDKLICLHPEASELPVQKQAVCIYYK